MAAPIPECPHCQTPMEALVRYGDGGRVVSCGHCRRLFLIDADGHMVREVLP